MKKGLMISLGVVLVLVGGYLWLGDRKYEDVPIGPAENQEESPENVPIVGENLEGEADPARMKLNMKTWIWISALYNDGRVVEPKKPGIFTLTFGDDGKFSVTTDCNHMGGSYVASGENITFSDIFTTLMYCEGSQESDFSKLLGDTTTYHFTSRGQLILDLKFDSGSVTFR